MYGSDLYLLKTSIESLEKSGRPYMPGISTKLKIGVELFWCEVGMFENEIDSGIFLIGYSTCLLDAQFVYQTQSVPVGICS
jgi:hypothetical protein